MWSGFIRIGETVKVGETFVNGFFKKATDVGVHAVLPLAPYPYVPLPTTKP